MKKYKTYKKAEFDSWCEDNFIEEGLAEQIWEFIRKEEVSLNLGELSQNEVELTIKIKLHD